MTISGSCHTPGNDMPGRKAHLKKSWCGWGELVSRSVEFKRLKHEFFRYTLVSKMKVFLQIKLWMTSRFILKLLDYLILIFMCSSWLRLWVSWRTMIDDQRLRIKIENQGSVDRGSNEKKKTKSWGAKCARYSCPADQQANRLHRPVSCTWWGG